MDVMIPKTDRRMASARVEPAWRRAAAAELLTGLRLEVTPEALKALDPFMGTLRVGEARWFALRTALLRGNLANEEAIAEQMNRWRQLLIAYALEYRTDSDLTPHKWAKKIMHRRSVDKYGNQFLCKPLHAVIWLETLGQDTSPASVSTVRKLIPDDFDPDSAAGRGWIQRLADGEIPTSEPVAQSR